MKKLLLLILGIVGCGGGVENSTSQPTKKQHMPKLVEFNGRDVVKTYNRVNNDKAELVGESEVKFIDGCYIYKYTLTANNNCVSRWEIFDHLQSNKPYMFEMVKDKPVTFTYKSKSSPVYVYRTATCFERAKSDDKLWKSILENEGAVISSTEFWHASQVAFYTIVPKDKTIVRDIK